MAFKKSKLGNVLLVLKVALLIKMNVPMHEMQVMKLEVELEGIVYF